MIDLTGKHICIIGGSRGIGAASARMAAKAGANVSITYRSAKDRADAVVAEVEAAGGKGFAVQVDIADHDAVQAAVASCAEALGPLHGMVVSAGIFEHQGIPEMDPAFWHRMTSTNLDGTVWSVKAASHHMADGGAIVIYTSTAGQNGGGGGGGAAPYCVTKAGQIMFMKCAAKELAPNRIRVNCVAPAWTETEMADGKMTEIGRDKIIAGFPLGRIGKPEDIAGATCYLLSDVAEFVTGMTLTVDGGMVMAG